MHQVGVDPEMFVVDYKGKIVSAIGLIGGSKNSPREVSLGAVQEDNVMAEINITPASHVEDFQHNIHVVLTQLDKILGETGHSYDKKFRTAHAFTSDALDDPRAHTFGCDPDHNIYTMEQNPVIDSKKVGNLRMCGGHIHLGFDAPDAHPLLRTLAVKWMDILVGGPLAAIDPDRVRSDFYGKAGNYRPKPYGVEYRTPSNFWLSDQNLITFVFSATLSAMKAAEELLEPETVSVRLLGDRVRKIIDSKDRDTIHAMVDAAGGYLPNVKVNKK
jgi:hypothetical protein